MSGSFDPYYKWLGIPPRNQPPNHYRLLAIELFESDREVIDSAANRLMAYLKTLATGDDVAASQKLLNEVAAARRCLLSGKEKAAYDKKLRAAIAPEAEAAEESLLAPEPFDFGRSSHAAKPAAARASRTAAAMRLKSGSKRRPWYQRPEGLVLIAGAAVVVIIAIAVASGVFTTSSTQSGNRPDARSGAQLVLTADKPRLCGTTIALVPDHKPAEIGSWTRTNEWVEWNVKFSQAGTYEVAAEFFTPRAPWKPGWRFPSKAAQAEVPFPASDGIDRFVTASIGKLTVAKAGEATLKLSPVPAGLAADHASQGDVEAREIGAT